MDRAHPLSAALAELRRTTPFARVALRGLTVDEVHRMMRAIRGQEVPWGRAEAIHRQTEGNPLFVQEVLRYLVEEGIVVREGGQWVRADGGEADAGIPEGLRDVIGKRLSRLRPETNQVLTIAAVIGRDFRLDALQQVADRPEEAVIAALEEAQARAIIEERRSPGGGGLAFRFMHAFFRQTLYEEIFAARRIRWHQQVGRALERVYGRRVDEHAAELAEHFANSSDPDDLGKAVRYGELAARRAMGVYAYGEAARHLERALEAQEVLDPDDADRRCDLLLALCRALIPSGESERVFTSVAEEAFALAETLHDAHRAVAACQLAMIALGDVRRRHRAGWAASATGSGSSGRIGMPPRGRWTACTRICGSRWHCGTRGGITNRGAWSGRRSSWRASSAIGRPSSRRPATWPNGATATPSEHAHRLEAAQLIWDLRFSQDGADGMGAGDALLATPGGGMGGWRGAFLTWGDRERAEAIARAVESAAARSHEPAARILDLEFRAVLATWDGALGRALELADAAQRLGEQAGSAGLGRQAAGRARRRALLYLGRPAEVLASIPTPANLWATGGAFAAQQAIYLAHAGRIAEATAIIDQFLAARDLSDPNDTTAATLLRYLLEAAVAAGHTQAVAMIEPKLAPLADLLFTEPSITNCLGRDLGGAARLLAQPAKARAYYQQGIAACTHGRHRPELALCRLELAELLLDEAVSDRPSALRTEDGSRPLTPDELKAEGVAHLDFAIGELRDMKMTSYLERSLRRKLQLQGLSESSPSTSIDALSHVLESERPSLASHAAPDGTVTLLFTDIENSTGLTLELGDQRWLDVLRTHHALVRKEVQTHGGFEVKCQGDGFMLAFQSARRALECAIAIQRAVTEAHSEPAIRVRMGLHTGEALRDADDFHGRDVVLAARIADQALGRGDSGVGAAEGAHRKPR